MIQKTVCVAFLVFGLAQCSVLPVEKCTLTDKACMMSAAQNMVPIFCEGMPEIGVEVMDVLKMHDVKFDLSGFQFSLSDGNLKGFKTSVIESVDWDVDKKKFSVVFHFDGTVKGHYTAAGRILILPISGDGQIKMKIKHIQVKIFVDYDIVKKEGKDYIKLLKFNQNFDIKENAQFHLTNLFNGNKELSDTLHIFVNENWKQLAGEFGKPLVDTAINQVFENLVILFDKIPLEDIANV